MIELFEQDIKADTRKSSKENQLKWENDGVWYKADYTGYEGLAEYVISGLLSYSSLCSEEYVIYHTEKSDISITSIWPVKVIIFYLKDAN